MYKDVGKRILAFMLLLCMFVTLVEWPTPVWAAGTGANTYRNGDGAVSGGTLDVGTVAAVFRTNGAEVLDRIMFEASVEDGANASATVSYYVDVQDGRPDSGTRIFSREISVQEGTNTYETGLSSQVMRAGTSFAIVVSIEGASFYTYGGTQEGQSYVQTGEGWQDMYTAYGRCAAVRASTYGVRQVWSGDTSAPIAAADEPAVQAEGDMGDPTINKQNVVIAVGQRMWIRLTNVSEQNASRVTWRSDDETVAQVAGESGSRGDIAQIYGAGSGRTEVYASYDGQEYSCTVTVTEDIGSGDIVFDPASPVVYNGRQQDPEVTVTVTATVDGVEEEEVLVFEEHYRLTYKRWIDSDQLETVYPGDDSRAFIDVGRYVIYARSMEDGGYNGEVFDYFVIEPKSITSDDIQITLKDNWEELLLEGQPLSELIDHVEDTDLPELDDHRRLREGRDYELELNEEGTALVIKGIGNYKDEKPVDTPQPITGADIRFDEGVDYIYTGTPKQPLFSVLLNGRTLSPTDYEIVDWAYKNPFYHPEPDPLDNIEVNDWIGVQIRGVGPLYYDTAEGYYNIKPKDIDNGDYYDGRIQVPVEVEIGVPVSQAYEDIAAALTITYNRMTLEYNKDYVITSVIPINEEAGTYRVLVTGIGNYTGTRTIGPITVGDPITNYISGISVTGPFTYNGLPQEPFVTITWYDPQHPLRAGVDYVIEYENNINANEGWDAPGAEDDPEAPKSAKVWIRGIGRYGGVTETAEFTILPLSLTDPSVRAYFVNERGERVSTSSNYEIEYSPDPAELEPGLDIVFLRNGEEVPLVPGVFDADAGSYTEDNDYTTTNTVRGDAYVKVGTHTVTVTGHGNFTGQITPLNYKVTPFDLHRASPDDPDYDIYRDIIQAFLDQEIYSYTGMEITRPDLTITHRSRAGAERRELTQYIQNETAGSPDRDVHDCIVEYSKDENGQWLAMGTYTVTVDAMEGGNYTGRLTLTFKITAIDIQTVVRKANFSSDSDNTVGDYTGPYFAMLWYDRDVPSNNELRFTLCTYVNGQRVDLVAGTDYEITSWNGTDHVSARGNTASVTITGIGKYYNTCTIPYLLAEDLGEYRVSMDGYTGRTYDSQPVELTADEIRVYDAGTTLSQRVLEFGEDYTVSYKDSNPSDDRVPEGKAVSAGTAVVYVEARPDAELPSANGCFRYRAGAEKKSHDFEIAKQDIGRMPPVYDDVFELEWTGSELKPHSPGHGESGSGDIDYINIYQRYEAGTDHAAGVYTLEETRDYNIVRWVNNVDPSPTTYPLAYAYVEGTGNYEGTRQAKFRIVGKSLDDIVSVEFEEVIYNGTYQTPDIVSMVTRSNVYDNTADIQNYVCTWSSADYRDHMDAGVLTASLTVHGVREYTGSERTFRFTIEPLEFTANEGRGHVYVSDVADKYTYKVVQIRDEQAPSEVACYLRDDARRERLEPGTDYTVDYDRNTNVSDNFPDAFVQGDTKHVAVILRGQGNYTGEYRVEFEILPKALWAWSGSGLSEWDDDADEDINWDDPSTWSDPDIWKKAWTRYPNNESIEDTEGWGTAERIHVEPIPSQTFMGIESIPVPVVYYQYGDAEDEVYYLRAGIDFDCEYFNNDGPTTQEEPAIVWIKGKGNFGNLAEAGEPATNVITVPFYIGQSIEDETQFRVNYPGLDTTTYTYDGYEKQPTVTVEALRNQTQNDWRALDPRSDYRVSYRNNVNAGTATIIVEGIGSYAGTVQREFTIYPKDLTDEEEITLTLDVGEDNSAPYTGSPVEPTVTIEYSALNPEVNSERHLTEDQDYTVVYSGEHIEIGPVTVTVTASGENYVGELTRTFNIGPAAIGTGRYEPSPGFRVGAIPPQALINGRAEPVPTLTYGTGNGMITLIPGQDYYCTYVNNRSVGTATVTLHGQGNYTGSIQKDFEIVESAENVTVHGLPTTIVLQDYIDTNYVDQSERFITDGLPENLITFEFGDSDDSDYYVTIGEGAGVEVLTPGTDYEVQYVNNDWIGIMEVNIVGTGTRITGTISSTVLVTMTLPRSEEGIAGVPGLSIDIPDVEHTGSAVSSEPIIRYYGKEMSYGYHYDVRCTNNINVGIANIRIQGRSEHGVNGYYEGTYEISANSSAFTVERLESSYMYRGEQIIPEGIVVKSGSETLALGVDYDLEYGPNKNVGVDAGTVIIVGQGRFANNEQFEHFDITPWEIENLIINLDPSTATYTGLEIKPTAELIARINGRSYTLPGPGSPEPDYVVQRTEGYDNTTYTQHNGLGSVTITSASDNIIGSIDKTFTITRKSLAVPPAGTRDVITVTLPSAAEYNYSYDGSQKRPTVSVSYQYGDATQVVPLEEQVDFTVTYTNNVNVGTATVRIDGIGNFSGYRNNITFEITEQEFDENSATVTFTEGTDSYPYIASGVEIKPPVTVRMGGRTLTQGTDYTAVYTNNTTVGTGRVTITGTGGFVGQLSKDFTITTHDINASDVTIEPIPNQPYTGSPILPEVVIKCSYNGTEHTLMRGIDFDVTATTPNTNPGEVTLRITGRGGYDQYSERLTTFRIASDISNAEVSGYPATVQYKASQYSPEELTRTLVVRVGDSTVNPSNYTVAYAPGDDGENVGMHRLIVTGQGDYGGTLDLYFEITAKSIADNDVQMFGFVEDITGTADYRQNITLRWNTIRLEEERDYRVEYQQAGNTNLWIMTVTGEGNYTGIITKNYSVESVDIATTTITLDSSTYTYTGSDIEPVVTVTLGTTTLREGEHYSVEYGSNRDVGVGTVRISGEGFYTGEVTLTFLILGKSVSLDEITIAPNPIPTQVYTGLDITPEVSVSDGRTPLVDRTDYTLRYENNRSAGAGTVTVVGRGNYTATKSQRFDILPYTVATPVVTSTSASGITISWTLSGAATGYEIQRQTDGGSWEQVALVGARVSSYTDKGLASGTTYQYRVRAYVKGDNNNSHYGMWSLTVSGTTR